MQSDARRNVQSDGTSEQFEELHFGAMARPEIFAATTRKMPWSDEFTANSRTNEPAAARFETSAHRARLEVTIRKARISTR
jgi:hypothetical protein